MQICSFYQKKGYKVEWFKGDLFANQYEKIYVSQIFNFSATPDINGSVLYGGTGIDPYLKLPKQIMDQDPSYKLYPNYKNHIGFSMKGCRFRCNFCVVPKKEGKPYHNKHIDNLLLNPKGENRLVLMDNDFFGSPFWEQDIKRIITLNLKVNFIQGLNIRIITEKQAELLAQTKYYNNSFKYRYLTFAWDRYKDRKYIDKGIKFCKKAGIATSHMQFFVLIGYDTTKEEDYDRVMTLYEYYGALPFVMPYNKNDEYQKKFTRWVNHRAIFKSVKWEDYNKNYTKTKKTQQERLF